MKERYEILKSKGLCYSCLRRGHTKSECRKRLKCYICEKLHPTILHVDRTQFSTDATPQQQARVNFTGTTIKTTSGATSMGAGTRRLLPIVPVKVRRKGSSTSEETYAFLDSGSNTTFCTEHLKHKLNIEGRKRNIYVQTLNGKHKRESYGITNLELLPLDGSDNVELPEIYTQASLPVNLTDLITVAEKNEWPHLQDVPLKTIDSEVELLVGVDVSKAMEPWDVVPGESNGPFAVKTVLGWVINGPLCQEICETKYDAKSNFVRMDQNLDQIMLQHFNRDFNERVIEDVSEHSKEDKQFMKIVENSVHMENGHYVMSLPFKNENCKMPNNKNVAYHRLSQKTL